MALGGASRVSVRDDNYWHNNDIFDEYKGEGEEYRPVVLLFEQGARVQASQMGSILLDLGINKIACVTAHGLKFRDLFEEVILEAVKIEKLRREIQREDDIATFADEEGVQRQLRLRWAKLELMEEKLKVHCRSVQPGTIIDMLSLGGEALVDVALEVPLGCPGLLLLAQPLGCLGASAAKVVGEEIDFFQPFAPLASTTITDGESALKCFW